jgi:hypothetical protein
VANDTGDGAKHGENPWLVAALNVAGCLFPLGIVVALPLLLIWAITALLGPLGAANRGPDRPNGPDRADPAP